MTARAIPLYEPDAREFLRWGTAGAIVLAAHLAAGAGYLFLHKSSPQGSPNAPAIILDLAPVPVAPQSDVDIAVGPQMQEQVAEPEPPKAEAEPLQRRDESPVVSEPEPPKAQPKTEKKPPAPRTTAAPRSPTHTASVPAAPAPASSSATSFPPSWINLLFSHLLRYRQYPGSAQANHQEGVVMLAFTMDRHGRVLSRHIARSSGVPALDAEALAMIERAQPLPAFPPNMPDATRSFSAPIKFSLR
jgi:protein TonB